MALVTRTLQLDAAPDLVWTRIGAFQDLHKWHPAAASVDHEDIDGVEHRRIHLEGGGEILERLEGTDGTSYAYSIIESPLPVTDYRSTLTVTAAGGGSVVMWSSTFTPTAEGAEDVVAGIYTAGFGALSSSLSG